MKDRAKSPGRIEIDQSDVPGFRRQARDVHLGRVHLLVSHGEEEERKRFRGRGQTGEALAQGTLGRPRGAGPAPRAGRTPTRAVLLPGPPVVVLHPHDVVFPEIAVPHFEYLDPLFGREPVKAVPGDEELAPRLQGTALLGKLSHAASAEAEPLLVAVPVLLEAEARVRAHLQNLHSHAGPPPDDHELAPGALLHVRFHGLEGMKAAHP